MVNDFSGPLVSRDILFSWYTASQFLPSPEWFGNVFRCTCSAWGYQSHSEPHHPAQNAKMVWAGPERRCVKHRCIGMILFQQLIHPTQANSPWHRCVCVAKVWCFGLVFSVGRLSPKVQLWEEGKVQEFDLQLTVNKWDNSQPSDQPKEYFSFLWDPEKVSQICGSSFCQHTN